MGLNTRVALQVHITVIHTTLSREGDFLDLQKRSIWPANESRIKGLRKRPVIQLANLNPRTCHLGCLCAFFPFFFELMMVQTLVSQPSILLCPHSTDVNVPLLPATSPIRSQVEQTRVELLKIDWETLVGYLMRWKDERLKRSAVDCTSSFPEYFFLSHIYSSTLDIEVPIWRSAQPMSSCQK